MEYPFSAKGGLKKVFTSDNFSSKLDEMGHSEYCKGKSCSNDNNSRYLLNC